MIETKARGREQAAGTGARRARVRPPGRLADPGHQTDHEHHDPVAEANARSGQPSPLPDGSPADTAARCAERRRAALYLDLWERHVSGTAIGGRGVAAPWFAR